VILVLSAVTSISWVVAQGGVTLPSRAPVGAVAGASFGPAAGSPGANPASPAPSRAPEASAAPSASPAGRSPAPTPTAAPAPTSDPNAHQVACPGVPDCYRYTIRAGDNLWSIARWFGVPLDAVYARNPDLRTTALRVGAQIVLPTPTR
jgi:nucleoid-associated protein YgaU